MSVVSGNNYTYTGTVLNNSIGYLIQRTPTTTSSDTLPTATELILAYVGVQDSANNGQSLTVTIYNNSNVTITMNPNTGLTFINSATDTILPQAVRTYTFIQTSATTIVTYIVGAAPVVVSQTNTNISLSSGNILVGNSSNVASGVAMTGDSTITNTGVLAVNRIAGAALGSTTATSGNLLVGSGTQWGSVEVTGDATMTSNGSLTLVNTAVVAGSYNAPNLTIDTKGRITAAANTNGLVTTTTVTAITNNTNQTWTAAQMFGGIITRNCNGANRTDTTATAALLVSGFTTAFGRAPVIGNTVTLLVINNSSPASTLTVSPGAGVSHVATTQTLTTNAGKNIFIRFANVATPAVVMYWDY